MTARDMFFDPNFLENWYHDRGYPTDSIEMKNLISSAERPSLKSLATTQGEKLMTAPTPLSAKAAHESQIRKEINDSADEFLESLSFETDEEKEIGDRKTKPKFQFEPKEHLTRNLRDHEGLQALAASLKQNREQNHQRSSK